jgi:hypothetical protein
LDTIGITPAVLNIAIEQEQQSAETLYIGGERFKVNSAEQSKISYTGAAARRLSGRFVTPEDLHSRQTGEVAPGPVPGRKYE